MELKTVDELSKCSNLFYPTKVAESVLRKKIDDIHGSRYQSNKGLHNGRKHQPITWTVQE